MLPEPPAPALSTGMVTSTEALLSPITVVLHHTRSAENVGGAARAMANMGLSRLVLAEPASWDRTRAMRVATEAGELLESAAYAQGLEEVLGEATLFLATSARPRKDLPSMGPEEAARILLDEGRRGGSPILVFGDERSGLPRWVLDRAHGISTIPTNEANSSLNLAQSVLVHAYAMRQAATKMLPEAPLLAKGSDPKEFPMPAADLARLRERARALLLQAGFLNPAQPDRILSELERLLLRAAPSAREGQLLLALTRQLEWATRQR